MASISGERQLLWSSMLELETVPEEMLCNVGLEAGKESPLAKTGKVGSGVSEQRRARKVIFIADELLAAEYAGKVMVKKFIIAPNLTKDQTRKKKSEEIFFSISLTASHRLLCLITYLLLVIKKIDGARRISSDTLYCCCKMILNVGKNM